MALIVTCRAARHFPAGGWNHQSLHIKHCGGATDGEWWFHIYYPPGVEVREGPSPIPGRDMILHLDPKLPGKPCTPPQFKLNSHPEVLTVRCNVYNSRGLFLLQANSPYVIATSAYSSTSWVRHRVSMKELCLLKDIPGDLASKLSKEHLKWVEGNKRLVPNHVFSCLGDWIKQTIIQPPRVEALIRDEPRQENLGRKKSKLEAHPPLEPVILGDRNLRSVKEDGAEIPVNLWNVELVPDLNRKGVEALRQFCALGLRWWMRRVQREFMGWFHKTYPKVKRLWEAASMGSISTWDEAIQGFLKTHLEAKKDWLAGRECVACCCNATWWEWTGGYQPHFWWWPAEYCSAIRDGVFPWLYRHMPQYRRQQQLEKDATMRNAMKEKLHKVRKLGYVAPRKVKSLTSFFAVQKEIWISKWCTMAPKVG